MACCGIEGIDPRALVRHIRAKGGMRRLSFEHRVWAAKSVIEKRGQSPSMENRELATAVNTKAL